MTQTRGDFQSAVQVKGAATIDSIFAACLIVDEDPKYAGARIYLTAAKSADPEALNGKTVLRIQNPHPFPQPGRFEEQLKRLGLENNPEFAFLKHLCNEFVYGRAPFDEGLNRLISGLRTKFSNKEDVLVNPGGFAQAVQMLYRAQMALARECKTQARMISDSSNALMTGAWLIVQDMDDEDAADYMARFCGNIADALELVRLRKERDAETWKTFCQQHPNNLLTGPDHIRAVILFGLPYGLINIAFENGIDVVAFGFEDHKSDDLVNYRFAGATTSVLRDLTALHDALKKADNGFRIFGENTEVRREGSGLTLALAEQIFRAFIEEHGKTTVANGKQFHSLESLGTGASGKKKRNRGTRLPMNDRG